MAAVSRETLDGKILMALAKCDLGQFFLGNLLPNLEKLAMLEGQWRVLPTQLARLS
jgi:hypothetical protein